MAAGKDEAWNYALAMIKMDGLEPSEELLDLADREKLGEVTTDDVLAQLDKKYGLDM
ncbi:MAG: antitoxin VbhA family protein [Lachnoclostridium sp.]|nr:antitoxin VbhA family protein [Lachnospira sp.]MCM1248327.1 antitoxin VbhA family protein [Lachnoclostridium sp.]